MRTPNNGGLKVHEGVAMSLLIGLIGVVILITQLSPIESILVTGKENLLKRDSVEIVVKGAVEFPGLYRFPSHVSMREVLEVAQPLAEADLRRYQLDKLVKRGRVINVKPKNDSLINKNE